MQPEILIVPAHEIDTKKWNRCISESPNGLIYAASDYLDHLADYWTGIIVNDYEAVMPVAWRKKYGIRYSYNVPFIQQLGVFSKEVLVPVDKLMNALFSVCRYGDYYFNFGNEVANARTHTNFILPLDKSFENITRGFSEGVMYSVNKAAGHGLQYVEASIDEAIDACRHLYRQRVSHVSDNQFERFKTVCKLFQGQDKIVCRKVIDKNSTTLSILLLLKDGKRLYNMLNNTVPAGREQNANYFLMAGVWKEFEQSGLLFDFEGSDLPGVRAFYKKYGATDQPYHSVHFNHLPWPLKLLRR
jgi:hypothetical protein